MDQGEPRILRIMCFDTRQRKNRMPMFWRNKPNSCKRRSKSFETILREESQSSKPGAKDAAKKR